MAIGSTILLVIVISFFLSSMLIRYQHNRHEKRLSRAKDELYPKIMNYLEDETKLGYFKYYFSGRGIEFEAFKEIIFELLTYIEGEDAEKLQKLLIIDKVYNYHKRLLDSWSTYKRVVVYDYINYIKLDDEEVTGKIRKDLYHNDQIIAFSAATALMASVNVGVRAMAFDAIIRRKRISRMAILEMLYKFHDETAVDFDDEANHLKYLIQKTNYPAKNIGILIQGVSEIGYFQLHQFLHEKLTSSGDFWKNSYILSALIEAMGNYYHDEASSDIRRHIYHESYAVRKACVEALANLPTSENLKALYNMLFDTELYIRYKAAEILAESGEEGSQWLQKAIEYENSHSLHLQLQQITERIESDYGVVTR